MSDKGPVKAADSSPPKAGVKKKAPIAPPGQQPG